LKACVEVTSGSLQVFLGLRTGAGVVALCAGSTLGGLRVDVIAIDALELDHLAKLLAPLGIGDKPLSGNNHRLVPSGGAANAVVA